MFLVVSIRDQIERNTLDCHLVWELKELDIEISIIRLENFLSVHFGPVEPA